MMGVHLSSFLVDVGDVWSFTWIGMDTHVYKITQLENEEEAKQIYEKLDLPKSVIYF